MARPASFTKQGIDRVSEITQLPVKIVRLLLEEGWTFTWDINQNLSWTKNGLQDLVVLGRPSGAYPEPPPIIGPSGPAGNSGVSKE